MSRQDATFLFCASAFIALFVLLVPSAAVADLLGDTHPGTACKAYYGSDTSRFDHSATKFKRKVDGLGSRAVTCPIFTNGNSSGILNVDVRVTRVSGTVSCLIQGYNAAGVLFGAGDSDSLSAGTLDFLTMTINPMSASQFTYILYCDLPEGAEIVFYTYQKS